MHEKLGRHIHVVYQLQYKHGEVLAVIPKTTAIKMIDTWMMLEMAHEEMVKEIILGIPRTARLMALFQCYKSRKRSTIAMRLDQLQLNNLIHDVRKRVSGKVTTHLIVPDGDCRRPPCGMTTAISKCNLQ